MQSRFGRLAGACALIASLLVAAPIQAQEAKGNSAKHDHSHKHSHDHSSDAERQIYKGYFEDSQIQPRQLTDWQGEWQSVFPYLQDGTLDPVMAHKAEHGSKSAEEYKAYYETGYRTDVDRIVIGADSVTFQTEDGAFEGQYIADGFEILNYKKATAASASSSGKPQVTTTPRPSSSSAITGSHRRSPITIIFTGVKTGRKSSRN